MNRLLSKRTVHEETSAECVRAAKREKGKHESRKGAGSRLIAVLLAAMMTMLLVPAAGCGNKTEEASVAVIPTNEPVITEVPEETPDPGEDIPPETFPPIETQEPYVDVATPLPEITPVPYASDKLIVANYHEHSDIIPGVQERLMLLWYMDPDEPTDYFGSITRGALEAFQRRNDLPVTGELNNATYNALFSNDAKVYLSTVGDEGTDVLDIEERLYELGYLDNADEVFDEVTEDAVKDFQSSNHLDADGKVGKNTKEALYNPDCIAKAFGLGDTGDKILEFQKRLQALGYLTTEPDGVFGNDTRMAVRRFQMQNELVEDGYLGPTTREKLMSSDAIGNALSISMQGSDVLNVQKRLYKLNYLRASDVNSYFTSTTEAAVKLFQKNNGLDIDGKVGRNTMNKLFSDSAVRAKAPVSSGGNNGGGNNGGGNNGGGGNGGGGNNGGGGSVEQRINRFISIARSRLGCKYVRGAKGPNKFDCSGLVYWCLNQAGVSQGYLTSYYWRNNPRYQRNTNFSNIKKGDVIVYYGHVGICSGNGMMIDASSSKGKVVERQYYRQGSWFQRNFICSYRIFR
ncbi:MAG: peptidoglycan-binding protein [Clostridia bacterium]|nr:peptidoglycan-binding protein [Clostridia bacterium]